MPQTQPPPPEKRPLWTWWWWLPLVLVVGLTLFQNEAPSGANVPYSTFYDLVEQGEVEKVTLRGDEVRADLLKATEVEGKSTEAIRTRLPPQEDLALLPMLRAQDVQVVVLKSEPSTGTQVFTALLPWVVIFGAWWFIARRMRGSSPFGSMMKPAQRNFEAATEVTVSFDDVAGHDGAKRDLQEVVQFLKEPERFSKLGGKLPRGVLLVGSPGTGKTLLARAVAGEAGVPFFSISGSEFIELFVGVGASRVRELFKAAQKAAPAIVFIDEIDAVGRSRGTGLGGGHDEREQTLNQLLAAMDGFERTDQVVVLAATNRPDVLDPALLRPGRFDRRVVVDLPEIHAREAILRVHTRDKPLGEDVNLRDLARITPGFSGADLANLANEAALHALRRGAERIAAKDFDAAVDKVQLGDRRETHLTLAEKRRVAVHEGGHALVAERSAAAEPLRRVTIIPRGMALGATQQAPAADRHLLTRSQLEARLRVLLGGYVAEQLLLGEVSSGAEHDLKQANRIAETMVGRYGMSDTVGPVYVQRNEEHPFLGARIATDGGVSDQTTHEVEQEARRFVARARDDAKRLLERHRPTLDRLGSALMEHETLEGDSLASALKTTQHEEAAPISAKSA